MITNGVTAMASKYGRMNTIKDVGREREAIEDLAAGLWVPRSYGGWFRMARGHDDKCKPSEIDQHKWTSLIKCQDECRRLNRAGE